MNPEDEPRGVRKGEDAGEALRRLERAIEELSRNTEELTRTMNETLAMLVWRVEAIEREVFPAGAAAVH
jgi:prefoldin subunit 5